MRLLSISDKDDRGILSFDLVDVLNTIRPYVAGSVWTCSGVEAFGPKSAELHRCDEDKIPLDSTSLGEIASGVDQIVEGTFKAFRPSDNEPWLIIRAVDSSAYDIETADERVLSAIRQRFEKVADYTGY